MLIEDADKPTNRSDDHWSLVLIQTPEYGGENLSDDELILQRWSICCGRFTLFKPENLK